MEPLCAQYNFQSSSMADSWADSEEKSANRSAEDMKEDGMLRDDEQQVAQEVVSN